MADTEYLCPFPGCETAGGADIVFVLDGSGSIGSVNFEKCKDFVRALVDEFDIGEDKYQIGLQQFSSSKLLFICSGNKGNTHTHKTRASHRNG